MEQKHKTVPIKLREGLIRLSLSKSVQELSVAELCREANVSRSSFYSYYSHIKQVYDEAVACMMEQIQPIHEKGGCRECRSGDKKAFCDFIRDETEWRGIVSDRYFISTWIGLALARSDYKYLAMLRQRGLTSRQAEVLFTFHMSGCYAVALSPYAKEADFDQLRRMLDKFIRAGHEAVCQR